LLGLTTQFPSQQRDLDRQPGFRSEPFRHPFRKGAFSAQAGSPPCDRNVTEVRPLGSLPFRGLLRYCGPLRLPAAAALQVMVSLKALSVPPDATPGLPGSSTDLSARALLNHPGRPDRCFRSLLPGRWQASPCQGGWPPPLLYNEAESGSLSLGLAPSLSGEDRSLSPLPYSGRNRPTPRCRLPQAGGRNSLLNEQFTSMTPFSHTDQPGLSWRSRQDRTGWRRHCRHPNRQALRALILGTADVWINIELFVREAMAVFPWPRSCWGKENIK